ncbi:unnamed protein product, partial [Meganyctiphanes norvegica]
MSSSQKTNSISAIQTNRQTGFTICVTDRVIYFCHCNISTIHTSRQTAVERLHLCRETNIKQTSGTIQRAAATASLQISTKRCSFDYKNVQLLQSLVLGALPLAVDTVNSDPTLLPGKRLLYDVADVGNSEEEALAALSIRRMTTMRDAGVLAFIGPDDNCANEALVAAAWNLPMITYLCASGRELLNKYGFNKPSPPLPSPPKKKNSYLSFLLRIQWEILIILN